jgi:hypothetical protein
MGTTIRLFFTIVSFIMMITCAKAQESPPAHEAENQSNAGEKAGITSEGQLKTYELPEVVVTGHKSLKEEQLIGPNKQPRWTASRRFPTTRVYVIPQGKFEFEWWSEYTVPRQGSPEALYLYEFGMGLPYRLQLDLYQGYTSGGDKSYKASQQSIELRWAMAEWGKIWANPTWYYEYTIQDGASNKHEIKLLLGDELAPRWHWGVNLVREWTVSNPSNRVEENGITAGLSYTVKDDVLSAGLELKAARENSLLGPDDKKWLTTVKIGPSVLWKMNPAGQIEFVPLIGIGRQSERSQSWLVVSWEL